jgi:hypothetical protein
VSSNLPEADFPGKQKQGSDHGPGPPKVPAGNGSILANFVSTRGKLIADGLEQL